MLKPHGNSRKNKKPHHLYEIIDKEVDDVFKYGISAEQIGKDGLSRRIRSQLTLMNTIAGIMRFFARIIIRDIPGRKEARSLEDAHIKAYQQKHGKPPRGNSK